ncbi:alpha/beta hydrolase [Hymenobacter siberiensis]|uniref:alpha/beta hydrolase n=1 Tax=Hymenobacter siberiensis TaxID=2848396 RepID=UPI001C1E7FA4|nr:acyl-CoA thioester hydrolase/BAAT C-terminal domain-containing protein [Hymenobacter siberiensis]
MRSFCSVLAAFCLLLTFDAPANTLDRVEAVVLSSPAGGMRLNGVLRLPTGPGPFPAAVLLAEHKAGTLAPTPADKQLLTNLADYLVSKGMVVLRLEERGTDNGPATPGTLAERSADALAALNYLRTRPQVDVTRLGLIGHGEGGNVALLASAQLLAPTFLVTLAAAGLPGRELLATQPTMYGKVLGNDSTDAQRQHKYRLDQVAAEQEATKMRAHGSNSAQVQTYLDQQRLRQKMAMRHDEEALVKHQRAMLEIVRQTPDNAQAQAILSNMLRQRYPNIAPEDVQTSVQTLTMPAYRNYLAFDPLLTLPKVQCPVLLLQGEDDAEVNATVNLALLKKGLRSNARVTELHVPGLNHALQLSKVEADGISPAPISPDAQASIYTWIMSQK